MGSRIFLSLCERFWSRSIVSFLNFLMDSGGGGVVVGLRSFGFSLSQLFIANSVCYSVLLHGKKTCEPIARSHALPFSPEVAYIA